MSAIKQRLSGTEVLVTGCFNVLHPGHIQLLEYANQFGSVTVGINCDAYLHKKYGESRTVNMLHRAYMLDSIRYVDRVVVFTQDTPCVLIRHAQPKYFVRGPDYSGVPLPEQQALDEVGARLIVHRAQKIYNARDLIDYTTPESLSVPEVGCASNRKYWSY